MSRARKLSRARRDQVAAAGRARSGAVSRSWDAATLSRTRAQRLADDARRIARATFPEVSENASCLVESVVLQCLAEKRYQLGLVLQAGTCLWPRVPDDSAELDSHFGYEWEGLSDPPTALAVAQRKLPVLHVWLASPAHAVLIDSTTRSFPERAREAGVPWEGPRPPGLLWGTVDGLLERYGSRRHAPQYLATEGAADVAIAVASAYVYPAACARLGMTYAGDGVVYRA